MILYVRCVAFFGKIKSDTINLYTVKSHHCLSSKHTRVAFFLIKEGGYRPVCVSVDGVSFGGVGVSGRGVEFVPVDAGAVAHGDAVRLPCALRACLPGVLVELLDPLVGDRVPDEP